MKKLFLSTLLLLATDAFADGGLRTGGGGVFDQTIQSSVCENPNGCDREEQTGWIQLDDDSRTTPVEFVRLFLGIDNPEAEEDDKIDLI